MRIGFHLPQIGTPDPSLIAKVARRAEEAGYASLWVSDHILMPSSGSDVPALDILDPVATLTYAAAVTKRIRLSTSVLVLPYRNPIHLAKELASLDRLCGGRLAVGVASGWLESEFRALRSEWERRGAFTDEAIRLMRALWSEPAPTFSGEFFSVAQMTFGPRPQSGRIPIFVGGASKRALRRAVELGDGWHGTRMTPDEVAERLGWLRQIAASRGRSLDGFSLSHRVYVGFSSSWTETGGYARGILAPPADLVNYFYRFAALGIEELLITPLVGGAGLMGFMDKLESEVLPALA